MRQIKCPDCNEKCIKHSVLKSGSQRWFCKHCKVAFTVKINNLSKELNLFLNWLFSTDIQADMPGKGRTFRRKTAKFWSIWPLTPKVEEVHDVVYLDGIYLARNLCVLICCNDTHVLGWYVCRYEHAKALFNVKTMDQAFIWINELSAWRMTYSDFLREMTIDEFGNKRSTHERLFPNSSIWQMIRQQTLFTFLEYIDITVPTTNNRIESGVKSHTLFVL